MNELFLINKIFLFLIIIIGLGLGFWVLLTNRKEKVNQWFFAMMIFIVLWNIFSYLAFTATEQEKATMWYRLNGASIFLVFFTTYFFSTYFPKKIYENKLLDKIIIFLCSTFFFISLFTDLIIKNVIVKEWGTEMIFGYLGNVTYLFFVLIVIILYSFLKKYFILEKDEKLKTQYFLLGISIFIFANIIFNIIFPTILGTIKYYYLGHYSIIFFFGFTAYAIVRRQLFEIKIILTSLLVALMATLLTIDLIIFTPPYLWLQILKSLVFIIFLFFGYFLIKSVSKEIKRREELEQLVALRKSKDILEIEVMAKNEELRKLAETLEDQVKEKTKELQDRVAELEKFKKLTIGRELKMIELKKEIDRLKNKT